MEELNLDNLIEKILNLDYCITIEDDLTEKIFKIEKVKENLKNLISKKMGFSFKKNSEKYSFWRFNHSKNTYDYYEKKGRKDFFIHEKLKPELNLVKISGEKYQGRISYD